MDNKPNKGAIFKNDKKESDKHPDYRGGINVDGKEYDIALWLNTSAKGVKYFSASVSEPFKKDDATPVQNSTGSEPDDLPF